MIYPLNSCPEVAFGRKWRHESCILKCGNITIHIDKKRYNTVKYYLQCYFQRGHLTGLVKINGGLMA